MITKLFLINEKMVVSSSETLKPIIFKSSKTLSMSIEETKPLIDSFKDCIMEWLGRIELNRNMYSIHLIEPSDKYHGGVAIKYNDKLLANLILERSICRDKNGKRIISASFTLKYIRQSDEILGINQEETIYFNDQTFNATHTIKGERLSLIKALDYIAPTRSEAIVNAIAYILKINSSDIILDSFHKRYVINSTYFSDTWIKPSHPHRFYKYVSLSVFLNMLETRSFRMNSIVCQSDESESLYIGNFLCKEYENEIERFRGYLKEHNILISSFTPVANDPLMWNDYGDEGKGIILGFESTGGDILTPIQYINEHSDKFKSLRNNIQCFTDNNIRLYFSDLDNMHRFVKNDKFKKEKEWRLVHEFNGDLDKTLYNGTYAYFHEFPFSGNHLKDLNLILVSVILGPKQRESNIPLLVKDIKNVFGDIEISYSKTLVSTKKS